MTKTKESKQPGNLLHFFKEFTNSYILPKKFTFPFAYEPHPLCKLAVKEISEQLLLSNVDDEISGKMYGVLVVQDKNKEPGYLVAFSGQAMPSIKNGITFVPSIYNRFENKGFFVRSEEELNMVTKQINLLENSASYQNLKNQLSKNIELSTIEIEDKRKEKKLAKAARKLKRENAAKDSNLQDLEERLKNESIDEFYKFKRLKESWKNKTSIAREKLNAYEKEIAFLKTERKEKSLALQKRLFEQYRFLNRFGISKSLEEVFGSSNLPPSGAGDCAGPKLLQYAFKNQLKPLAMAEFWWGKPPKSEIRKQGNYYPACSSKCKPILKHMLEGILLDDDPMLAYKVEDAMLETIYEDEHLLIINKPSGLLSVPSKNIEDSVLSRMQKRYPEASGPLLAHRLDRATSGLMIITKSEKTYKGIQAQFINKTLKKQYIAVLEDEVKPAEGAINLPIAVDENNRPMQKVCYEKGKPACTEWKVLNRKNGKTRILFKPITGRTHQLRVHAAHTDGLNSPITGDTLYGTKADRLLLHACKIEFIHPFQNERVSFKSAPDF